MNKILKYFNIKNFNFYYIFINNKIKLKSNKLKTNIKKIK